MHGYSALLYPLLLAVHESPLSAARLRAGEAGISLAEISGKEWNIKKVMRWHHLLSSGANGVVAVAYPLVGGKRFKAHRPARMQFLRTHRHFRTQAKLAAVGEAR